MRSVKAQYFLCYAVLGSLLPYLSVYLQQTHGLSLRQVGYVLAAANLAPFIGPVAMTFLADARLQARRLIGFSYGIAAIMLGGVVGVGYGVAVGAGAGVFASTFALTLMSYALFQIAFEPIMPLQDGLNFSVQADRRRRGRMAVPFHIVRVWGTVGFILPGIVIWALLRYSDNNHWIIFTAIGFALAGGINSLFLPAPERGVTHGPDTPDQPSPRVEMPTAAALRACLEPPMAVFCLGVLLLVMSTAAYYGFFPVYLEQTIGFDRQWLGLVAAIGVVVEIPFMLGFGRLVRWLGLRRVMLLGVAGIVARMLLLCLWVHPAVAIGIQAFHGLHVLAIHVVPIVYLNDHADDHFRSSIQGLFRMVVLGTGRVAGSLIGGLIAEVDVRWVFAASGLMSLLAGVLFLFAFENGRHPRGLGQAEAAASQLTAP